MKGVADFFLKSSIPNYALLFIVTERFSLKRASLSAFYQQENPLVLWIRIRPKSADPVVKGTNTNPDSGGTKPNQTAS